MVQTPAIDDGARRAIECIAHDAFKFGTQTEAHQELLLLRVQDAEAELQRLGAELNQTKVLLQKTENELALQKRKATLDLTEQEEKLTGVFNDRLHTLVETINDDLEKALHERDKQLRSKLHV